MAGLLGESLEVLRHEVPAYYRVLCDELSGQSVAIQVDAERFRVRFRPGLARVAASESDGADAPPQAEICTTRATILDVLEGTCTMTHAVDTQRLSVRGPLAVLETLDAGLSTYVHGAVRAPSFSGLLVRLRALGSLPIPIGD